MKTRCLFLLCLVLAIALPISALAEASPVAAESFPSVIADISSAQVDAPVEEFEAELGIPGISAFDGNETAEISSAEGEEEDLPDETQLTGDVAPTEDVPPAGDAPTAEDLPQTEEDGTQPGDSPADAPDGQVDTDSTASEGTDSPGLGEALKPRKIKLRRNATKTVYLGIPYVISVNGGIKRCKSGKKSIATASKDGSVTLKKPGTVRFTVTTATGKKLKLTLNVKPSPAPGDLSFTAKAKKITLKWTAAKYATGYLVETSADGEQWEYYCDVPSDRRSLNVADAVTGTTYFRVAAILGDVYGGVSNAVSVLTPVTGVKVICEEKFYYGPSDRMNITWDASPGATSYAVYRTSVPSEKYRLIGTTKSTWYADTRDPKKLYAYRIQPIRSGAEDAPLSDPVTLWSGLEGNVLPPADLESSSGIILVVNKKAQVVTAYIKDSNGRYTVPLRHMICSTGRTYERTRNGTYTLKSKKGEWYTYPGPSGDTIRWPSVYRDGYYFHSPLYNRDHTIRGHTVRRLGSRASAGCVRLKSKDAEWVYKNCPIGTAVYICDGGSRNSLKNAIMPKDVSVKGF